jgi:hypothetical protein
MDRKGRFPKQRSYDTLFMRHHEQGLTPAIPVKTRGHRQRWSRETKVVRNGWTR